MMRVQAIRVIAAVLLVCACAKSGTQPGAEPRGDRNLLTKEQLNASNQTDVYSAVERLRPEWLTSRGPTSVTDATPTVASVYMNGQLMGRAEFLRDLRIMDVTEIRFFAPGPAAAKFGMGHPRGVIEVTRR